MPMTVPHASAPRRADTDAFAVPEGFVPRPVGGGFLEGVGPIYVRREEEGRGARYGFLVCRRHCNPMGICHGMLATLADVVLGLEGVRQAGAKGHFTTVSLTTDFLAPAPLGAWVEAEAELLSRGRSMLFVQGLFTVGGTPVLRASGVFRLPSPPLGAGAAAAAGVAAPGTDRP
jgi:acyl-coenzyme A thioesterase PaaI-like protein